VPEALAQRPAIAPERGASRGVRLAERSDLGKIDLRGDPTDRAFMAGVGRVLDLVLPSEPCSSSAKGQVTALWCGPDQWLITCAYGDVTLFMASLAEALEGVHAALTDVSDGRVAIRLAGPSARDVLAKGCPLDLHPRFFSSGTAAGSLLAKAEVLIHLVQDGPRRGPVFDLYVARSFAPYLWAWLEDAGQEHGVQIDAQG
jgi:sarcosine oxidase, subunit gamma